MPYLVDNIALRVCNLAATQVHFLSEKMKKAEVKAIFDEEFVFLC